MGWFGKKDKVIDLSAKYKRDQEKIADIQQEQTPISPTSSYTNASSEGLGFFGAIANSISNSQDKTPESSSTIDFAEADERKRRLAKRLSDMTEKIEDLSNQIYHLQQRIEVVERKNDVNRFE